MPDVLDLYCGAGGWGVALNRLGLSHHGYDNNRDAIDTYRLGCGPGYLVDLTTHFTYPSSVEGIVASPPCQPFSKAGKQQGRNDPRGRHALIVAGWAAATRPKWIAVEQVPGAHSMFNRLAVELSELGYHVATYSLDAETFGVPQTRRRVILMAGKVRKPGKPVATHSKFYPHQPTRRDPGVKKWVSMAEALGWNGLVGFPRKADTLGDSVTIDEVAYRERDLRTTDKPSATVTGKARSWERWEMGDVRTSHGTVRSGEHPAPTITASLDNGNYQFRWVHERPSPTIVGSFRPDIVARPNWRKRGPRQSERGSVSITYIEGGILQSFSADYPWQGSTTSKFTQVGNAIPPLMAQAVIEALIKEYA